MAEVTEELTRKVAHLARLELTASEVTLFTTQMRTTLEYVDQLSKVDVRVDGVEVEPLYHPTEGDTPMREDEVRPSPVDSEGKPKMLRSAPETLYDGFKVPPIL